MLLSWKRTGISDIQPVIAVLNKLLHDFQIFLFEGDLGTGKTTLIKAWLEKNIGIRDNINSPTYSIINEYHNKEDAIYHIDCYR